LGVSWTCPTCGRTFSRPDQFHSHETVGVDEHFADRPDRLRSSFDRLVGSMPPDVRVEPLKSVIVFAAHRTFAFVTVQAKQLLVGVFLDRALDSSRVVKIDQVSAHKVGSVVAVRGPGDVDDELRRWLRQAYELSAQAAPTSGSDPSPMR
jgi:hypothetical protein